MSEVQITVHDAFGIPNRSLFGRTHARIILSGKHDVRGSTVPGRSPRFQQKFVVDPLPGNHVQLSIVDDRGSYSYALASCVFTCAEPKWKGEVALISALDAKKSCGGVVSLSYVRLDECSTAAPSTPGLSTDSLETEEWFHEMEL